MNNLKFRLVGDDDYDKFLSEYDWIFNAEHPKELDFENIKPLNNTDEFIQYEITFDEMLEDFTIYQLITLLKYIGIEFISTEGRGITFEIYSIPENEREKMFEELDNFISCISIFYKIEMYFSQNTR